jgi:hypothetical protein
MNLGGSVIGFGQPYGGVGTAGRSDLARGDYSGGAAYDELEGGGRVGIYAPIGTETVAAVEARQTHCGNSWSMTHVRCAPGAHPRPKPREAVGARITDGG